MQGCEMPHHQHLHKSNYLFLIMAKKDPTDLSVEEKLKALYQLQTTLSAIDEKRALRGELPLEAVSYTHLTLPTNREV